MKKTQRYNYGNKFFFRTISTSTRLFSKLFLKDGFLFVYIERGRWSYALEYKDSKYCIHLWIGLKCFTTYCFTMLTQCVHILHLLLTMYFSGSDLYYNFQMPIAVAVRALNKWETVFMQRTGLFASVPDSYTTFDSIVTLYIYTYVCSFIISSTFLGNKSHRVVLVGRYRHTYTAVSTICDIFNHSWRYT